MEKEYTKQEFTVKFLGIDGEWLCELFDDEVFIAYIEDSIEKSMIRCLYGYYEYYGWK